MNLRLVLKNGDGELFSCVIAKDVERDAELEKVFSVQKGYGFCVECSQSSVCIVDYFHADTRAHFEIVSQQETQDQVSYYLTKQEH